MGITIDSRTRSCQIYFLFEPGEDFELNLTLSYNKSTVSKQSDFIFFIFLSCMSEQMKISFKCVKDLMSHPAFAETKN